MLQRLLPYLLSILLPGVNVLSSSGLRQRTAVEAPVGTEELLTRWVVVSVFLIILWHLNSYLLVHPKLKAKPKPMGWLLFVVFNLAYLFLFISIDRFLLPSSISLATVVAPWATLIRMGMAALLFAFIQQAFTAQQEKDALKVQNLSLQSASLRAQLEMLKQQINPHFMFNSLNTLIDLIEEDGAQAVDFVRHFSNLYRFVLQSSKRDLVRVADELAFLEDYWQLLKMRFNEGIQLHVTLPEHIQQQMLPPLSLQLLIENAVKHNEVKKGRPLVITIAHEGNTIVVTNPILPKVFNAPSEGLGLTNLQYRYQYLLNQEIVFGVENDHFKVVLPLKANDYARADANPEGGHY